MSHLRPVRATVAMVALLGSLSAARAQQDTIFYSTQLRPIEEASKVRDVLLKGVSGKVTYIVDEPSAFAVRMKAETQAGKRTASVVGALHGELQPHVPADLQPIDDVVAKVADRGIPSSLMDLGKLGTADQKRLGQHFDEIRALEDLKKRLAAALKSNLQIAVKIKFCEPKTIERSEGKSKRVIDLREVKQQN